MCSNVGSSTSSVVLRVGTAVVVVVVEHYGQGNSSRELSLPVAEEGRKKEGRGGWTRDVNHNKRVGGGQLKEEDDKEDWRLREKWRGRVVARVRVVCFSDFQEQG